MSGERLQFDPILQLPLDAGWLSPAEGWSLAQDAEASPHSTSPAMLGLWLRVELFHSPWIWAN